MKKKTVGSVMAVAMLFAISLFFVGGTYARYVSTFDGTGSVDIAKWAVALKNGGEAVDEKEFELTLKAVDNEHVVTGKIAPSVTATGEVEVELNGTEVSVDVISSISETAVKDALTQLGVVNTDNNDISVAVTVAKDEGATNIKEITGNGSEATPYLVALNSNANGFGETDKIKVTVTVTWTNTDANSTTHTEIGEKAATGSATLKVPFKLQIVQHIEGQKYTPAGA